MNLPDLSGALSAWRESLGPEQVLAERSALASYEANVGGLQRTIAAVLRPGTTADVVALVKTANQYRVPLYPISTGKNWGMGSRLPVGDHQVVVDLGRMNRIRELSAPGHYVVVEPGVTQAQVYTRLQTENLPLMLNVIGSSRDTSLLGNALDRGVGYFALRADTLSGLEVVLGNGTVMRTGFGHYPNARTTHLYKFGVGPSLDGLFCQSNFGIVTAAGVALMPRPPVSQAMVASLADERDLGALVDTLAGLRRDGVFQTIVHVGNRARGEISISPVIAAYLVEHEGYTPAAARAATTALWQSAGFGAWSAVGGLLGTAAMVGAARQEIRRALRGKARLTFLSDAKLATLRRVGQWLSFLPYFRRQLALLHGILPFHGLTQGIPTDAAIPSIYWPLGEHPADPSAPDQSASGVLYCLPFIPLAGDAATRLVALCHEHFSKHGFTPYITLNITDERAMECVINLAFPRRDPARCAAAHACHEALLKACLAEGFPPYRVGIQAMPTILSPDDSFWQTTAALKQVLDPNGIIAPGHYSLR